MVAVAQLVEHRIVIPVVAGSSPVGHPNFVSSISLLEHQTRSTPLATTAFLLVMACTCTGSLRHVRFGIFFNGSLLFFIAMSSRQ